MMHTIHRNGIATATSLLLLFGLWGCTLGPKLETPASSLPEHWSQEAARLDGSRRDATTTGTDEALVEEREWWRAFNDPLLTRLIMDADRHNREIGIAMARIDEARALRGAVAGERLPEVGLAGEFSRARLSENGGGVGSAAVRLGLAETYQNSYQLGTSASWEVDLFGRIRNKVRAADARLVQAEASAAGVRLLIRGETARVYFEFRGLQQRLALVTRRAALREEMVRLIEARRETGLVSDLDLAQARGQWELARARIPALVAERHGLMQALSVLVGDTFVDLEPRLMESATQPAVPLIGLGVPADLLRRRPDVLAAEHGIIAAAAQVGSARADLLPRFDLIGTAAFDAQSTASLFRAASLTGLIAPRFSFPIFSRERIRWHIRAEEARHRVSLLAYEQAVLTALAEIESAAVGFARQREAQGSATRLEDTRQARRNAPRSDAREGKSEGRTES